MNLSYYVKNEIIISILSLFCILYLIPFDIFLSDFIIKQEVFINRIGFVDFSVSTSARKGGTETAKGPEQSIFRSAERECFFLSLSSSLPASRFLPATRLSQVAGWLQIPEILSRINSYATKWFPAGHNANEAISRLPNVARAKQFIKIDKQIFVYKT